MARPIHPEPEQLRAYLLDQLPPAEKSRVDAHLQRCGTCQARLEELTADPTEDHWRALRRDRAPSPATPEAADLVRRLVERTTPLLFVEATSRPPAPERIGEYSILGEIGRGAVCVVYKALDVRLGRMVALKCLHPERLGDPTTRARFSLEARAVGGIQHDHVVRVHDVGEFRRDGVSQPYLVMEWIEHGTLADRLSETPQFTPTKALDLVRQIALGLEAAHANGLVHRDIKPSNILLARDHALDQAKIADFGIVRVLEPPSDPDRPALSAAQVAAAPDQDQRATRSSVDHESLTQDPWARVGTPEYMSPEQIHRKFVVDQRSDLFSLGVVFYRLLTGFLPFRGASTHEIQVQVTQAEPLPPRSLVPRLPLDLDTICLKLLEKEPSKRYPSARELIDDLDRVLKDEPIRARRPSVLERLRRGARRNPALAVLLTVGSLAVLGVLGVILFFSWETAKLKVEAENDRKQAGKELREAAEDASKARERLQEARDDVAKARNQLHEAAGVDYRTRLLEAASSPALNSAAVTLENVSHRSFHGWELARKVYEDQAAPRALSTLGQHDFAVIRGVTSPGGDAFFSSGQDGRVVRWDTRTRESIELAGGSWSEARRMYRHVVSKLPHDEPADALAPDAYLDLAWNPTRERLAAASKSGRGVVWLNAKEPGSLQVVLDHGHALNAVAWSVSGDRLLFGDKRGRLLLRDWNPAANRFDPGPELQLPDGAEILVVRFLPTLKSWVVGQRDGSIKLLDHDLNGVLASASLPGPIWDLDPAPSGDRIAVGSASRYVRTFQVKADPPALLRDDAYSVGDASAVHAVRWSRDGRSLLVGTAEGLLLAFAVGGEDQPRWRREAMRSDTKLRFDADADFASFPLPMQRRFTGLEFVDQDRKAYVCGLASGVMLWDVVGEPTHTEFWTWPNARFWFDPRSPERLWVGGGDGRLGVWDSRTGRKLCETPKQSSPVVEVRGTPEGGWVAVAHENGWIRFWRLQDAALLQDRPPIRHRDSIRSMALHPQGGRVAVYDVQDHVTLLDVTTGAQLDEVTMTSSLSTDHAVKGIVAYSPDGDRLAAAGPGQSLWVFHGDGLHDPEKPSLVAGKGGTAVRWNPKAQNQYVIGDTLGRIKASKFITYVFPYLFQQEICSIDWSNDGRRIVAIDESGAFQLFDPEGLGDLLSFRSEHLDPRTSIPVPPVEVSFDVAGRRIAVLHRDGFCRVFETGSPTATSDAALDEPVARWSGRLLVSTHSWSNPTDRVAPVLDSNDCVVLLYLSPVDPSVAGDRNRLMLGRELGTWPLSQWRELELTNSVQDGKPFGSRSLALRREGDTLLATVRREFEVYNGRLELYRVPLGTNMEASSVRPEQLFPRACEEGFDVTFTRGSAGFPRIWHFSHDGWYLMETSWSGGGWRTRTRGRQGDGYGFRSAEGPGARVTVVFSCSRNQAEYSKVLTALEFDDAGREIRSVVDPAWDAILQGVNYTFDGAPVVLSTRPHPVEGIEFRLAVRRDGEWVSRRLFSRRRFPSQDGALVRDPRGEFWFSWYDPESMRILLARGGETTPWTIEVVTPAREVALDPDFTEPVPDTRSWTLLDSHGRPVVLVQTLLADQHVELRVYRRDD